MDGAPTNEGSGSDGFPDFGDVSDVPPGDTPIARTDCGSGPSTTVRGTINDPAGRLARRKSKSIQAG
ncbi:MAG: hypothetical protein ABI895_37305 [Deltaproteobacteria bacterium]